MIFSPARWKKYFYEVVSFINKLPDNYVFRSSANEYLLVLRILIVQKNNRNIGTQVRQAMGQ